MLYTGHYINLDRSTDRRAYMETQLAALDPAAQYRRFPAVEGNPFEFEHPGKLTDAEIGCLTSHYMLLQMHLNSASHLHIVEDDVLLAKRTVKFIDQIILSGMVDDHDILFMSTIMPFGYAAFQEARKVWRRDIKRANDGTALEIRFSSTDYYAGASSYLVNRKSVGLLCDIISAEFESGARRAFDILIRNEAQKGNLKILCLFPFISSVAPVGFSSTIGHRGNRQLSVFAMDMLRHSFFVECDMRASLELTERHLNNPDGDPQDRLQTLIAGFLASDDFQKF